MTRIYYSFAFRYSAHLYPSRSVGLSVSHLCRFLSAVLSFSITSRLLLLLLLCRPFPLSRCCMDDVGKMLGYGIRQSCVTHCYCGRDAWLLGRCYQSSYLYSSAAASEGWMRQKRFETADDWHKVRQHPITSTGGGGGRLFLASYTGDYKD